MQVLWKYISKYIQIKRLFWISQMEFQISKIIILDIQNKFGCK